MQLAPAPSSLWALPVIRNGTTRYDKMRPSPVIKLWTDLSCAAYEIIILFDDILWQKYAS